MLPQFNVYVLSISYLMLLVSSNNVNFYVKLCLSSEFYLDLCYLVFLNVELQVFWLYIGVSLGM